MFDNLDQERDLRLPSKPEPAKLKVFVSTDFPGVTPTGTAALIVAANEKTAHDVLLHILRLQCLIGPLDVESPDKKFFSLREIPTDVPSVNILRDGNY